VTLGGSQTSVASAEDLEAVAERVRANGRRCVVEVVDVRDNQAVDLAVRSGLASLGQIDIVFANAGIGGPRAPFWELTPTEWRDVIDVNLTGIWNVARAVAPHLIERQQGSIVVTSSVVGTDDCVSCAAPYMASKAGVIGLMRNMALDLGRHNVRVNAVLPGSVATGIGRPRAAAPVGAPVGPLDAAARNALRDVGALPAEAIANAVCWLASDEARYVSGAQLVVDAGRQTLPRINPSVLGTEP
jgi:NAD(P)-dependent dehydrogenase (short-subunit alcohol dehydrogenase family)